MLGCRLCKILESRALIELRRLALADFRVRFSERRFCDYGSEFYFGQKAFCRIAHGKQKLQKREKRVNELEKIITNKDAIVRALKEKVANALLGFRDKGLSVVEKNGKVYVSMDAKLLFASGSTKVDSEGIKALKELAKVLEDQKDLEILVEGHTDSDKMKSNSHPVDNWELSVLRATSVVKIMLKNSKMDPTTVSATGRSQYIPIDVKDKSRNKKITFLNHLRLTIKKHLEKNGRVTLFL